MSHYFLAWSAIVNMKCITLSLSAQAATNNVRAACLNTFT
jgi:hypothetical protein